MPGFSRNGREIWQIVAHIRALNISRAAANVIGNAPAGQQLFESNHCLNCHWLNGTGAPRGLDLFVIGSRLVTADLAPEFWTWQATTKTGAKLRGRRLN